MDLKQSLFIGLLQLVLQLFPFLDVAATEIQNHTPSSLVPITQGIVYTFLDKSSERRYANFLLPS